MSLGASSISGGGWWGVPSGPAQNASAVAVALSASRRLSTGSTSLRPAPFPANDPSILVDIGIASLKPRNLWSDVLNNSFYPVNFSAAPVSATSGTLLSPWPFASSNVYNLQFSDGTVHTATFTKGSTAVSWSVATSASVTANASASPWIYTVGAGGSAALNDVTGFNPGTANNNPGRIQAGNAGAPNAAFDADHGAQGTVYIKFQRAAICADQSQSSTAVWYDSNGNAAGANFGSYPPCLFSLVNQAVTNSNLNYLVLPAASALSYLNSSVVCNLPQTWGSPSFGSIPLNPQVAPQTLDPTYAEYIFTWEPSVTYVGFTAVLAASVAISTAVLQSPWPYQTGTYNLTLSNGQTIPGGLTFGSTAITGAGTTSSAVASGASIATTSYAILLDYMVLQQGILPPNSGMNNTAQLQNGQFYAVTIGNFINGPNTSLGGCIGPFNIQRFQISSAVCPIPTSDCLVNFQGDSYVAAGGVNGGQVFPGLARKGMLANDLQVLSTPDTPGGILGITTFNNASGPFSSWVAALQAYSLKQLGYSFKASGSAKSGYSDYFTGGFNSCAAFPTPNILFTAAISAAASATLASVNINGVGATKWTGPTGQWLITFPSGQQRLCFLTNNATTCTWTGTLTDANAATQNSTAYTTGYWDSVGNSSPEVMVMLDSVNNQLQTPSVTGVGVTPAADLTTALNYIASNTPSLKAIFLVEAFSLEKLTTAALNSAGYGGTQAQLTTLTASWRTQLRNAFNNGSAVAGQGKFLANNIVPVVYVPTYENLTGDPVNGSKFIYGSNTNNIVTSGNQQGPSGALPDIHGSPDGYMRLSDLIWTQLRSYLASRPQWANS